MKNLLFLVLFTILQQVNALNHLPHPRVFIKDEMKSQFIQDIKQSELKSDFVERKLERVEKYLKLVESDSTWLFSRLQMHWKTKYDQVYLKGGDFSHGEGTASVPTVRFSGTRDWATEYKGLRLEEIEPFFEDERGYYLEHKETGKKEWVQPSETGHMIENINQNVMNIAADAAFLYWYTGEEKYARLAFPVYDKYMKGMYHRQPPVDLTNSAQQRISGLATFEVIHEKIVVDLVAVYDFLYDYMVSSKADLTTSVTVFQKWADQIITNGVPDNNWNLFQARFITLIALALDDDETYTNGKGKQYYLKYTFEESTDRQYSLEHSLKVYDEKTGMWPESASYSVHVIETLLKIFTLLDQSTDARELSKYPVVEKAALASFNYLFPSGYLVGFGDSKHSSLSPGIFELLIAYYRKYDDQEKEKRLTQLLQKRIEKGEYQRKTSDFFEFFFYVDQLKDVQDSEDISELSSSSFYAPNVSMFNQKIGHGLTATMISTVGSFGNHAHANGISMEIFANGWVQGPDKGKGPSYWHDDHRDYYSQFPAHNTVVVDGQSTYSAMRSDHPYTLESCYPLLDQPKENPRISYGLFSFFEPKTSADQKRFTTIISTQGNQNYILDIFYSKKISGEGQRHDYIYHNLGEDLSFFRNGETLDLENSTLFGSQYGDLKAYDYWTMKKKVRQNGSLEALFSFDDDSKRTHFMKAWVKGSDDQDIFSVLTPHSNALTEGTAPAKLLKKPIPAIVLRKESEAWSDPFAVVFNPYRDEEDEGIEKVEYLEVDNEFTESIVVTHSKGSARDLIHVNSDVNKLYQTEEILQKGTFSLVRESEKSTVPEFIFGGDLYHFEFEGWTMQAIGHAVTFQFVRNGKQFIIENSGPMNLNLPISAFSENTQMEIHENGKITDTRKAIVSRRNEDQIEFRLEKAFDKIILNF